MSTQSLVRDRLAAYSFDEPGVAETFTARLANENHWTAGYTRRVITEYKRFAELAVTAGHPVTPSDQVDRAWHLHLTYTRAYWGAFCEGALGQPLHHDPSRGGAAEQRRYRTDYARTLASYRTHFGAPPPADIWPAPERRFGRAVRFQRVDMAEHWVLRKPALPRLRVGSIIVLGGSALGCASLGLVSPLDLPGGAFLSLYLLSAVIVFAAAALIQFASRRSTLPRFRDIPDLDAYEAAFLAGGAKVAVATALTNLVATGVFGFDERTRQVWRARGPRPTHPLERALDDRLTQNWGGDPHKAEKAARLLADPRLLTGPLQTKLEQAELVAPRSLLAFACTLLVPTLGVTKIAVGVSRDKPVGYLVVMLIICVALIAWKFWPGSHLTRRGRDTLSRLRTQYSHLAGPTTPQASANTALLPMAVALYGSSVLGLAGLDSLSSLFPTWHRRPNGPESSGGGDGGGCGNGGGGGGCGGGCGGCGGAE